MSMTRRQFMAASAVSTAACSAGLKAHEAHGPDLSARMLTKAVPSSGEQLPVIGLGTLDAFNVETEAAERSALAEILNMLVAKGGNIVDTSPSPRYGSAEVVLGELSQQQNLSTDLFFATKVFSEGAQAGIDEMEGSFAALQVSQIDLMQVHSLRDWQVHIPSIRGLKDQGRVRYLGVTAHRDSLHEEMLNVMRQQRPDFIQINYNLLERKVTKEILPLAQDLGIAVMINVPFAKAELFNKTRGLDVPEWAQEFDCHSWAQFFLKYLISDPAVTCAIPRTSKPHHMLDNLMAGYGRMPDQNSRVKMERFIDQI